MEKKVKRYIEMAEERGYIFPKTLQDWYIKYSIWSKGTPGKWEDFKEVASELMNPAEHKGSPYYYAQFRGYKQLNKGDLLGFKTRYPDKSIYVQMDDFIVQRRAKGIIDNFDYNSLYRLLKEANR